jgi:hypothetical protein
VTVDYSTLALSHFHLECKKYKISVLVEKWLTQQVKIPVQGMAMNALNMSLTL